jgi:type IV pilus assembly protein PilC
MTTTPDIPIQTFAYTAQTFEGEPMTGTIDASSLDDASKRLSQLRLRVMRLDPAPRQVRAKPLSGEDFAAFNQQLAHLSAAGLPIEQGLRLIAEDLRHGGLAQSVRDVSQELERGVSLGDAFKRHEKQFPPLYGALIDAGVRASNLPAVLLNLGRHLDLVARLRAALWRAFSYPLTVMGALLVLLIFLGHYVLPQFQDMYTKWFLPLPMVTRIVFGLARATPYLIAIAIMAFVGMPLVWAILRATRMDRAVVDLALPLPMVGPILKRNLIARWCDAMKLAVQSGMDLPAAVRMSGDVVGSPRLRADGDLIIAQLGAGQHLDQLPVKPTILPIAVLAVAQLAAERSDLPNSLQTLATMYEQQAEIRLASLQTVLTPLLILLLGAIIGVIILGLFAPMASLMRWFSL